MASMTKCLFLSPPFVTSPFSYGDVTVCLLFLPKTSSVPEIPMRRIAPAKLCAVAALSLSLVAPVFAHHVKSQSTALTITTSSPKALAAWEKGVMDYENLYLERCNQDWREAVKEDPNLAVAWAWIAFNSGDPQEISQARAKAKQLAPRTTPGEQLMVAWVV